jgi:hypothetical protein
MKRVAFASIGSGDSRLALLFVLAALVSSTSVGCQRFGRTPVEFTLTTKAQQQAGRDLEAVRDLAAEAYLIEWTVWNSAASSLRDACLELQAGESRRDDARAEQLRSEVLRELRAREAWSGRPASLGRTPVRVTGAPPREYVLVLHRNGVIRYQRFGGVQENGKEVSLDLD